MLHCIDFVKGSLLQPAIIVKSRAADREKLRLTACTSCGSQPPYPRHRKVQLGNSPTDGFRCSPLSQVDRTPPQKQQDARGLISNRCLMAHQCRMQNQNSLLLLHMGSNGNYGGYTCHIAGLKLTLHHLRILWQRVCGGSRACTAARAPKVGGLVPGSLTRCFQVQLPPLSACITLKSALVLLDCCRRAEVAELTAITVPTTIIFEVVVGARLAVAELVKSQVPLQHRSRHRCRRCRAR